MIENKKIIKSINNYSIYIIFFIVFSPIFLSLDFSHGLRFDAFLDQIKYSKPSVSLSGFFIIIYTILLYKYLLKQKGIIVLFILTTIYTMINLYYSTPRSAIIYAGIFLPLLSYYIFKNLIKNRTDVYKKMYLMIVLVIILKLLSECYVYIGYYIDPSEVTYWINIYGNMRGLSFFVFDSIRIYNYHDYFSFIFYLAIVLSIHNIFNKKMIFLSIFIIVISNILIIGTSSRFFIYSIYLIPILLVFYYFTKFKLSAYFYLFISTSIIITISTGLIEFNVHDVSLGTRYYHNHSYLDNFTLLNFILPFLNQHRHDVSGSMHNELLEIFSFFGWITIYYYFLIKNLFIRVNNKYKLISYLLMYIILIGSLIQINISNPYVGIMLGMVLAVLSVQDNKEVKKNGNVSK